MGNLYIAALSSLTAAFLMLSCGDNPFIELPRQFESEHLVYHYEDGDRVDDSWQESYYAWLVDALDVQVPQKLHYFKYRDRDHLGRSTGHEGNGYADSKEYSFHTIWPVDNHECVHVVVFNTMGRAPALFDEGIAVAHQTDPSGQNFVPRWSGTSVHTIAREFRRAGEIPALNELLESTAFRRFDDNMSYPLVGSFVRFLIDSSGLDRMKDFTSRSDPNDKSQAIQDHFFAAYNERVDQAWERWLAFLDEDG